MKTFDKRQRKRKKEVGDVRRKRWQWVMLKNRKNRRKKHKKQKK
jgi:hypothetical protein